MLEMNRSRWKVLLLDLDGTVFPWVPERILEALESRLNFYRPFPKGFLKPYFKSVLAFSPEPSLGLLLRSLGLWEYREDFSRILLDINQTQEVETILQALGDLKETCRDLGIQVFFFSSAGSGPGRFAVLDKVFPERPFLLPSGGSKVDPSLYSAFTGTLPGNPDQWLLCDDVPLVLWTAKQAGLSTVHMRSVLFASGDCIPFQDALDFQIQNIRELDSLLRSSRGQ